MHIFIFTLIGSLLFSLLTPAIVFEDKARKIKSVGPYTLSRLGFLGWLFASLLLAMAGALVTAFILDAIGVRETNAQVLMTSAVRVSWVISLIFISTRRLADIGWSLWLCLICIFFPLSIFWFIALMCVPAKNTSAREAL